MKKKKDELKNWKWPYLRMSGDNKEYACPCGVGHSANGVHGCCGCCSDTSFKMMLQRIGELPKWYKLATQGDDNE